jgi:hypothetical protein
MSWDIIVCEYFTWTGHPAGHIFNTTFTQPIMICNTVILPGGNMSVNIMSVNSVDQICTSMRKTSFRVFTEIL